MTLPLDHFRETEKVLRAIEPNKMAHWLLNVGYYPEQNIVPPSFNVDDFTLSFEEYESDFSNLQRDKLITLSYPKTPLTSRVFSIQHPNKYHDIVFHLEKNWHAIIDHLFHKDINIFSYSFPIPISSNNIGDVGELRAGRMIYEWLEMAETDLVAEAQNYKVLVKADIANCYNSIYTHSIAWALHGIEDSRKDIGVWALFGCKIDRLVQYANDTKTNGVPIGSAVSDLICEIILSKVDREVSEKLKALGLDYVGTRFKDDYRFLCNSTEEGIKILKELALELGNFNLTLNEAKTRYEEIPDGLYRLHSREYFLYSLSKKKTVSFKDFEHTLLAAIDIHTKYPGTSILEKFLAELFTKNVELKLVFDPVDERKEKEILKALSLLFLLKRKSEKTLGYVLSVVEAIFDKFKTDSLFGSKYGLREVIKNIVLREISYANSTKSTFELVWFVYFSRYLDLGITDFDDLIDKEIATNEFLKSLIKSRSHIFGSSGQKLFVPPKDTRGIKLAKRLRLFDKETDNEDEQLHLILALRRDIESLSKKISKNPDNPDLLIEFKEMKDKLNALLHERIFICEDERGESIWKEFFKKYGIQDVDIRSSRGCTIDDVEVSIRESKKLIQGYNPKVFRSLDRDGYTIEQVEFLEGAINEKNQDLGSYCIKFLPVNELENFAVIHDSFFKEQLSEDSNEKLEDAFVKTITPNLYRNRKEFGKKNKNSETVNRLFDCASDSLLIRNMEREAKTDFVRFFPGKDIKKLKPNFNVEKYLKTMALVDYPDELNSYLEFVKSFFDS